MTGEVTVPLLPCAAVDDVVASYETLGFRRTPARDDLLPGGGDARGLGPEQ